MSIFEYDEERELMLLREEIREMALEEGMEEGLAEGRRRGLEEGHKAGLQEGHKAGLQEGKKAGLQNAINMFIQYNMDQGILSDEIIVTIQNVFHLPADTAKNMVTHFG